MTTRAQLARLAARIDDLARRVTNRPKVAFVWQDPDETEEQALARHHQASPEARQARQTYIFTWRGQRREGRP